MGELGFTEISKIGFLILVALMLSSLTIIRQSEEQPKFVFIYIIVLSALSAILFVLP